MKQKAYILACVFAFALFALAATASADVYASHAPKDYYSIHAPRDAFRDYYAVHVGRAAR